MKQILHKILNKKTNIFTGFSYLFYNSKRNWSPPVVDNFDEIIINHIQPKNEFTFIQIGSNNGMSNDPLYDYIKKNKCKGVLIEPVSYLFKQLIANYKGVEGVYFENIAVSNTNSEKEFYIIKESDDDSLPIWYNQISSFKLETILTHKDYIPNIEQLITKQITPTITFHSIIEKYKFDELDILTIDTEGYDFEIIKTINFNVITPSVLIFENKHLTKSDYKKCLKIMKKHYLSIKENLTGDTICYDIR
ncbi:MAG: FkbM family methyltransferase [Chitinophagaceae bacterium]|nr:MAG: FkbM family methyltransferase [Chitinophagaceae bacterium]